MTTQCFVCWSLVECIQYLSMKYCRIERNNMWQQPGLRWKTNHKNEFTIQTKAIQASKLLPAHNIITGGSIYSWVWQLHVKKKDLLHRFHSHLEWSFVLPWELLSVQWRVAGGGRGVKDSLSNPHSPHSLEGIAGQSRTHQTVQGGAKVFLSEASHKRFWGQ